MTQKSVLIVGAGHAGFQVAVSLRQHGFGERICLINDEPHLPYQRPPLSKAYLKGEGRPDSLMFRPDKFYRDQNVELISDRAAFIDRAAHRLLLASGAFLDYGHLVIATGARNRLLDLPNANLADVKYLRILDESELTTREAEDLTGVTHSEFSRIRNTQLRRFTLDRLIAILGKLDEDVEVTLSFKPRKRSADAAPRVA